MLTNFDLEEICEDNGYDLIGVYSKNELPTQPMPGSYIVNMQDSDDGQGTHWVVFKIFPNKKCCYSDSFGTLMPIEIANFLKPFKPVATNNRHIQDVKSTYCGFFCLSFIKYFNNFNYKKNDVFEAYDDYLNCFSNNPKQNDKIVLEILNKY